MPKMLRLLALLLLLGLPSLSQAQPIAWINEFHYDNSGGDVGEFIEVIVDASFTDLANLEVVRYNGNGGSSYGSTGLNEFGMGEFSEGYNVYSFTFPSNGIQNGAPDGIALCYDGAVVMSGSTYQFLSYEGDFTANGGCADGMNSTDIGIAQSSSTPAGSSIGLQGTGMDYDAFTWTDFGSDSRGFVNTGQTLIPPSGGTTTVQFAGPTSHTLVGGTAMIAVTINNPSATSHTSVDVDVLSSGIPGNDYALGTTSLIFPAGSDAPQYVLVETSHDAVPPSTIRKITLGLSNIDGGNEAELGVPGQTVLSVQNKRRDVFLGGGNGGGGEEDEPETIAEARAKGEGPMTFVEGIVTRARGRIARIQDETGGIAVFQTSGPFRDALDAGGVREGDLLRVEGTLTEFRGLLEVDPETFTVVSRDNPLPTPQVVTLAQLIANGEDYESELIDVQNMTVDTGDATFQTNQNYVVTDASDNTGGISISTFGGSDINIEGVAIPNPARFVGVLGQFDSTEPLDGGYQLIPVEATDVIASTGSDGDKITSTDGNEQPGAFTLHGNYPNPFNPSTTIRFDLPEAATVRVQVYDMSGRQVWNTASRSFPAGAAQHLTLEVGDLASGMYVYRMLANGTSALHTATGRMILQK